MGTALQRYCACRLNTRQPALVLQVHMRSVRGDILWAGPTLRPLFPVLLSRGGTTADVEVFIRKQKYVLESGPTADMEDEADGSRASVRKRARSARNAAATGARASGTGKEAESMWGAKRSAPVVKPAARQADADGDAPASAEEDEEAEDEEAEEQLPTTCCPSGRRPWRCARASATTPSASPSARPRAPASTRQGRRRRRRRWTMRPRLRARPRPTRYACPSACRCACAARARRGSWSACASAARAQRAAPPPRSARRAGHPAPDVEPAATEAGCHVAGGARQRVSRRRRRLRCPSMRARRIVSLPPPASSSSAAAYCWAARLAHVTERIVESVCDVHKLVKFVLNPSLHIIVLRVIVCARP